jgi:nucleoside-diphosphate-sugar epimerase
MKILVTGGAGYLGSILTGELLQDGHHVIVLDNFSWGVPSLAPWCANPNLEIHRGDVREASILRVLVRSADVILPLAALVGAPLCEARWDDAWSINVDAVRMLAHAASAEQRIVIPISNSGYGIGDDAECTEESPLHPVSTYGHTKVEAEKLVMDRGNAVSLRLATLFGISPRMRTDLLVNDFVLRALRDRALILFEAHFRRNFVHVRDAARAFVHALNNWEAMKDNVYNVGLSSANLTKLQLCERIAKHVPFTFTEAAIGEDPDKRDYVVSNAKIEATGWAPRHSLDDGIAELLRGYRMFKSFEHGNV